MTQNSTKILNFSVQKREPLHVDKNHNLESLILNEKGIAYQKIEHFGDSIDPLKRACVIKRNNGELISLSNSLDNLCIAYLATGCIKDAWNLGYESFNIRNKINHLPKIFDSLLSLSLIAIELEDLKKFKKVVSHVVSHNAFNSFERLLKPVTIKLSYKILNGGHIETDMLDMILQLTKSIDDNLYNKTIHILKMLGDEFIVNTAQLYQSRTLTIVDAENTFGFCFRFFKVIGHTKGMEGAMRFIGNIYEDKNDWSSSLDCYKLSLNYAQSESAQKADTLIQIVNCYRRKNDMTSAVLYAKLSCLH